MKEFSFFFFFFFCMNYLFKSNSQKSSFIHSKSRIDQIRQNYPFIYEIKLFCKTLQFSLKQYSFYPLYPKSVLLYNTVSSSHILVFSYLVCLLIIGEFELLHGRKSCELTKRNKYYCYLIGLNWHAPRRQFIWTRKLEKRAMDSHTLGTQNRMPFYSFQCTTRLYCLSLQTWTQEGKEEIQIWVNFPKPVKNMSFFFLFCTKKEFF